KRPTRSNSGVGQATKKVRRRTDHSPDIDDPIVDKIGQKIEDVGVDKLSYKSMLMGTSPYVYFPENEDEFVRYDRDVVTKLVKGISSIAFSDRLHKFIERKMARTIIVKHLGRKIGFNALLNNVTTLWSSRQSIQLMDLENGYYLVRFQDEGDFNKVLVGGPWVIFGQYLTARPWSPDFLASDNEMDIQVVWIGLPCLSERYYSKCLLRVIKQAIGPVVKLDTHTNSGRRGCFAGLTVCLDLKKPLVTKVKINGRIQRVEYKSLPVVCFNCGLYGHNFVLCSGSKNNASDCGVHGEESVVENIVDLGVNDPVLMTMDGGNQLGQIKMRDLGKDFNANFGESGQKESNLGEERDEYA
ncbi:hypothetical protein Gorai_001999, partial [Gossypium raimondii]|nr:hypothetical protein [Gossypium raimondii]